MKKSILLVVGTFILGTLVWSTLAYMGMYGESTGDKVTVSGISYEYIEDLTLAEKIELIEKLNDTSDSTKNILLTFSNQRDALGYIASLKLARLYDSIGEESKEHYVQALELHDTRDIKYEYAQYLENLNEVELAIEVYKVLLPDKLAMDRLLRLKVTQAELLEYLYDNKQWAKLVGFYEENKNIFMRNPSSEAKSKYAVALLSQGSYKEGLPIIEELYKTRLDDTEIKWWYGRSLEGVGRLEESMDIYKSIGERGAYNFGLLLEKEGKLKEAAEAYSMSNLNISKWKGAHLWDELGYRDQAIEVYMQIVTEESAYQDDAAYRLYVLQDNGTRPKKVMEVLEKSPIWMKRLQKKPIWPDVTKFNPSSVDRIQTAKEYMDINREDLAKIEISIIEGSADNQEKLILGNWYMDNGNYPSAVIWGIRALRENPSRSAYELAYPRPYEGLVRNWAEEFGVDPYLVWAIMREESHFRESAVSRVGALGLMQIMPTTGQDIATRLKMTINETDLLNPDINIRFGTYYIRSMLNMFSGDVDKALAAYNGGGGNVKRWSRSNIGSTVEGFPTSITFLETREYITKVGNSYYIYKWLYENEE